MSQFFQENAHNRIDPKAYGEGWERVFGKKEEKEVHECCSCTDDQGECCICGNFTNGVKDECD